MLGRWTAALCVLCALLAHQADAQPLPTACIEAHASLAPISRDDARAAFEDDEPHQLAQDGAAPSPVRDEELPWCTSGDDPRCAPLHGSGAPSSVGLRIAFAIEPFSVETGPIPSADHELMPHAGLLPSAGTESRLERPPRAARRAL